MNHRIALLLGIPAAIVVAASLTGCDTGQAPSASGNTYDCKSLIQPIIDLSKTGDTTQPSVVTIYRPRLENDAQEAYLTGAVTIPKGKVREKMLVCTGTAAASDNATYRIEYGLMVDVNGDQFSYYHER